MIGFHLYTAKEVPEAPECRDCQWVLMTKIRPSGITTSIFYEVCEVHEPKGAA